MSIAAARQLLDFSQPKLDVNLLDQVVGALHRADGENLSEANEILSNLKEHPDAWQRVDQILQDSNSQETKFYACQILESVIKTRWKVLPREQCGGIKDFIVELIIKTSSDDKGTTHAKVYLSKLNMILVQILKQEWPRNWPNFISEICGASKTSEALCRNNMVILKLLSEEVFEFSAGQMTQAKINHLKKSMSSEFSNVFELCMFVLNNTTNAPLLTATLETLLRFCYWIPMGFMMKTEICRLLIYRFLDVPEFQNVTLKCLTEIASISKENTREYQQEYVEFFRSTIQQLKKIIPLDYDLRSAYAQGQNEQQAFIQNLALFLQMYLKNYAELAEQNCQEELLVALGYLVNISEVEEVEVFKVCLEFWNALAGELYRESPSTNYIHSNLAFNTPQEVPPRRRFYIKVLPEIRKIMIGRMAKPEEVLVVENENGEVIREQFKDTDSINLYKTMRETLVYLTHLDHKDTEQIMTQKLSRQVDSSEWSWKNLNTLCWAIGSISGAMGEDAEKRFLVVVIKDLLGLCEMKRGKDNKAIIASNIMYVVGQYPRFLRAHWKFLKTVVNKLFEFMHETHDGVQDMACDTFIKIAQKCKRHFVQIQAGEVMPFIEEILNNITSIICDLQPHQYHTFYEAVGLMIQSQSDAVVQENLVERYMQLPNQSFTQYINAATADVTTLRDPDTVKNLAIILKTNVRACKSLGHPYITQLAKIYLDLLNVYKVLSESISSAILASGDNVTKQPLIRSMKTVKKEILILISLWVSKTNDIRLVADNFVDPLLDAVLIDYRSNVPAAREPEVLSTMATIVNRLESMLTPKIPKILDAVFECTLEMINKNFEEYPEHRTNFFLLLQAINKGCFTAFTEIPPPMFKLILDSIVWAYKHTMRNVNDTGLEIMLQLLKNVEARGAQGQEFYKSYLLEVLSQIFGVVTDTTHVGGLPFHCQILCHIFKSLENGTVAVPLYPNEPNENNPDWLRNNKPQIQQKNIDFVQNYIAELLKEHFKALQIAQIKVFVTGLFTLDSDPPKFREHIRDFLVEIKEYAGEDSSHLFLDQKEEQLREAAQEKLKKQKAVPGVLNPHEIKEEGMDGE
jgi:exportin-1